MIPASAKLWQIAAFGFAAGLPLPLSGFTLRQWMTDRGLGIALVAVTASVALPYSLKFLWAPLLDRTPPLFGGLGRRRGWLLTVQPALALGAFALVASDPARSLWPTLAAASFVAFLSASQDIAIDAWRIEVFAPQRQGAALAAYVWGYRIALLVAGSGVIGLASQVGWQAALLVPAGLLALAPLVTLAVPGGMAPAARGSMAAAFARPVREMLARPKVGTALAFVVLFKLGDALVGPVTAPFYRANGFTLAQVATIGPFQLAGSMAGIAAGGVLVARLGAGRALLRTGIAQTVAITFYLALTLTGPVTAALDATLFAEYFAEGMADAAFLALLSSLCSPAHAAMQYAILSSLAGLGSRTVASVSGRLVEALGWTGFFGVATMAAVPAMLLMLRLLRVSGPRRSG